MDLDRRKLKILSAIVAEYIRTGEPVGSKRVAELLDAQISSATCRNEMSQLFELGLLEQPHTSAGRIPSHMGFRVYLDRLLTCDPLTAAEKDEIDALFNVHNPDPDRLLADAADALARFTGCATVSSTKPPRHVTVRRVELIPISAHVVMIVVIASNGVIKSKIYRLDMICAPEILDFFTKFANDRFANRSVEEISNGYVHSVAVALGEYSQVFTPLLAGILELCRQISDGQFYTQGSTNLLEYPEFHGLAYDLLTLLEDKSLLQDALEGPENQPLHIKIGKENHLSQLENSTVLVVRYNVGQDNSGIVGVIGPVRMDYQKLIPHVEYFAKTLGNLLSDTMNPKEES